MVPLEGKGPVQVVELVVSRSASALKRIECTTPAPRAVDAEAEHFQRITQDEVC